MNHRTLDQKEKKIQQQENTAEFIELANLLQKTGRIKFYNEIVKALEWNKSTLSGILNGHKLIDDYNYKKFKEVYFPAEEGDVIVHLNKTPLDIISEREERLIRLESRSIIAFEQLANLLEKSTGRLSSSIKLELEKAAGVLSELTLNELNKR